MVICAPVTSYIATVTGSLAGSENRIVVEGLRIMVESTKNIIELERFAKISAPKRILEISEEKDYSGSGGYLQPKYQKSISKRDINKIRQSTVPPQELGKDVALLQIIFVECCKTDETSFRRFKKKIAGTVKIEIIDKRTGKKLIKATITSREGTDGGELFSGHCRR
jgi:hypothetical protein